MTIEEKIKELCYERKLTIPQLAENIGMSKSFYSTLKNDSLKVSTLLKIAEVFKVPASVFFELENGPDHAEIKRELEEAKANLAELTKSYVILKEKHDNLVESKSLNENIVELMRKNIANNEKLLFLALVHIYGLQATAERHIISSILAAHPEIDEKKDSKLLQKYINKDPFTKEFKRIVKVLEPELEDKYEEIVADENIFDEN